MDQLVSHGKTMRIRALGGVKAEYVFIRGDSRMQDVYDSLQELAPYTKESTVMISLNIYQDIMASCRVNTKISNLLAKQFLHNISLALNVD